MAQDLGTAAAMDDDSPAPEVETAEPAPIHTLDAHMAPYLARLGHIGTVGLADLRGFYMALRYALLAHLESPEYVEPSTGESLDMLSVQRKEQRDAQTNEALAYPDEVLATESDGQKIATSDPATQKLFS